MSHLRGKKIGFIGSGNMARAIAVGLIRKGIVQPSQLYAADISQDQRDEFEKLTTARSCSSNLEVAQWADLVILAVKPFHVAAVCEEIRGHIRADQLIISICAGITTQVIAQHLGEKARVVRVMPNTPALIGCGATAVSRGPAATPDDVECALELFGAVGVALELDENYLDLVTGLSGSGPAYLFYFAEALIAAAQELGLERQAATILVKHTLYGASRLALESERSLEELRAAVTTKGGTTEAGLRALEQHHFFDVVKQCVAAATHRSAELSQR